jgi:hypothetical protein
MLDLECARVLDWLGTIARLLARQLRDANDGVTGPGRATAA